MFVNNLECKQTLIFVSKTFLQMFCLLKSQTFVSDLISKKCLAIFAHFWLRSTANFFWLFGCRPQAAQPQKSLFSKFFLSRCCHCFQCFSNFVVLLPLLPVFPLFLVTASARHQHCIGTVLTLHQHCISTALAALHEHCISTA